MITKIWDGNKFVEYRPKEKEDGSVDAVISNSNTNNDNGTCIKPSLNNFQDYKPTRVEVVGQDGKEFSRWLDHAEYDIHIQDDGRTIKLFETPIKKEWYKDESNFPALVYDSEDTMALAVSIINGRLYDSYENVIDMAHGCRLATQTERDSLYVEDKS